MGWTLRSGGSCRRVSMRDGSPKPSRYLTVPGLEMEGGAEGGSFRKRGSLLSGADGAGGDASSTASFRPGLKRGSTLAGLVNSTGAGAIVIRNKAANIVGASVATLGVGDTFGEASLLHGASRRAASAVCNTPCSILVIPRAALTSAAGADRESKMLSFLKQVPALASSNSASLAQLLRTSKRRIYTLGEKLTTEGTKGSSLMLLFEGEVALSVAAHGPAAPSQGPHTSPRRTGGALGAAATAADAFDQAHLSLALGATPGKADAHVPRDMPLRLVGPGQLIPCKPAPMASRTGASSRMRRACLRLTPRSFSSTAGSFAWCCPSKIRAELRAEIRAEIRAELSPSSTTRSQRRPSAWPSSRLLSRASGGMA